MFLANGPKACLLTTTLLCSLCLTACETIDRAADATEELVRVEGLGSLSFLSSAGAAAQDAFLRGVLLLHSFEFEPSAEAFREAQEADVDFALAYWGEAMTYNHPLWREKDVDAAREVLGRLAPSAEERRAKAGSEREAMYLDAIEALYADGTKEEQDLAYMDAMRVLHEAYLDDQEARAFYALAVLGSRNGSRDFATYVRAAAVAQPVFDANPDHPGAVHYIIHAFDDPVHAPLGLPAARAYAEIAPNAAHAQHMTTHIFVALGMWEDVVSGNIRARDTQDAELEARGRRANLCGHYSSWLHYGHLMLDKPAEGESLMDSCHGRMAEEPDEGERSYFLSMRARHILDSEDWDLAQRWTIDASQESDALLQYEFTNAFAALRQGNATLARQLLAKELKAESPYGALHVAELEGLVEIAEGNTEVGLATLRKAAEAEDALPFAFGPPRVLKPTFELLGEELLRAGRAEEAATAYRRANERNPGRPLAVEGLKQALAAPRASS